MRSKRSPAITAPRLIADLGGTNARFALTDPDGLPSAAATLNTAAYPGVVEAVRAYLGDRRVEVAAIAVATPVTSDWIAFTNSPWAFSIEATRTALGLERLEVINDFTAQALAVPLLAPDERVQIGPGAPVQGQPIAVIGAGTGLGVAGLINVDGQWHPIASEGGHISLAINRDDDVALFRVLRRRFEHVSRERVLSGPGLVNLACALAEIAGESIEVTDPGEVTRRAAAGTCRHSVAAFERFSWFLGAAAGDLVLTLCATGGVYIGGGLCRRIGSLFDHDQFRAGLTDKGRFHDYLTRVPTYLVTRQDPGLLGAAAALQGAVR